MTIEVRFDGERQRPLLAKRAEGGRRDEVAIEIAEPAASRDPYVSRSQPLPSLGHGVWFRRGPLDDAGPQDARPPCGGHHAPRHARRQATSGGPDTLLRGGTCPPDSKVGRAAG